MMDFKDYKGREVKKLPIDYGRRILKLNWVMSSSMLDEYIYENDKGELFYVKGVWQAGNLGSLTPHIDPEDTYHMAIVIPIKSRKKLVEFLSGEIILRKAILQSTFSTLLAMRPNTWYDDEMKPHSTMHHVGEDGKEISRNKECELHEFKLLKIKKCPTKTLPGLSNPKYFCWDYKLKQKFSFIFIDEDEKKEIFDFIKKYGNENRKNKKILRGTKAKVS